MQSQNSFEERCQYIYNLGLECERKCHKPITPPARRYCKLHKETGPKQNKAITQKKGEHVKNFRTDKRNVYLRHNSNSQHRRSRDLTKRHLKPLVARGEALREQYQCLKLDDLYQRVLNQLITISSLRLNPPINLPSAHMAMEEDLCESRTMLESHPGDGLHSPRDSFLLSIKELDRDKGGWLLSNPFPSIWQQAHELQEAWRLRGDMLHLTNALFVNAEWWRQRFLANPDVMNLWKMAVQEVASGAFVARLYKGKHKRVPIFLDFYARQAYITLALDIGMPDEATYYIHSLQDKANKVANLWGEGSPVTEAALFISSTQQALYYLSQKDPVEAEKHFNDAETMFANPMQWRPVSTHQEMAYIRAGLAIEKDAPEQEELVHEYIALSSRNPSLEQHRNITRFKNLISSQKPDTLLPGDIYVETCLNYLQPLLLPYTEAGKCGGDAISRTEEGGDVST
jgi:hypothetical protein